MKKTVKYLIEAFIILAIIAVAFYAYSILKSKSDGNNLKNIEVTVDFMQIRKEFIDDINEGDIIFENSQYSKFGEVKEVFDMEESIALVRDYEKGEFIETTSDKYYQRKVIIEAKANVTESAIKVGDRLVKIGSRIGFIFNDNLVDGTIIDIDFVD